MVEKESLTSGCCRAGKSSGQKTTSTFSAAEPSVMGTDMISLSIFSTRVLAIYLIANSLNVAIPILALPEAMGSIAEMKYPVWVGYVFTPMLTGTALWFLSPAISKRLSSEDQLSNLDLLESTLVRAG